MKLIFRKVDWQVHAENRLLKQRFEGQVGVSLVGHCENSAKQTEPQIQSPQDGNVPGL